jgi:hypothetical protein
MKSKAKSGLTSTDPRQIEADKTSRLRALRLAKEAEDREAAARVAAATPPKPTRRRSRAAEHSDQPGSV